MAYDLTYMFHFSWAAVNNNKAELLRALLATVYAYQVL